MTQPSESYQEIVQQEAARREAVQVASEKKAEVLDFFDILKPSEIFFTGCTPPYYLGLAAAAFWRTQTGLPARSVPSTDLALYPELYYAERSGSPALIALSRTGKTTETIWAAQEFGKKYPGRTALIGCNPHGMLAEMASLKLLLPASAENTVPQTRSFSAMLLAALLVGAYYSGDEERIAELQQAPKKVARILQTGIAAAQQLGEKKRFGIFSFWGADRSTRSPWRSV